MLKELEMQFGKYKKIVLTTTGKAYKVPLRDILTVGIKGIDLPKYPEWKDKNEWISKDAFSNMFFSFTFDCDDTLYFSERGLSFRIM